MNILWVAAAIVASGAVAAGDGFRDLQVAYRCEVVRRLEQIYATGDPQSSRTASLP